MATFILLVLLSQLVSTSAQPHPACEDLLNDLATGHVRVFEHAPEDTPDIVSDRVKVQY